jgi:hypothetical protein
MKTVLLFLSLSFSGIGNLAFATTPTDTLKEPAYALSSRNGEARSGKYKHVDVALAFNANTNVYTLDVSSEKPFDAYLEITDQDENVIFFKPVEFKPGRNRIAFEAENGHQALFRLSFTAADKTAVFIVRELGSDEADAAAEPEASR